MNIEVNRVTHQGAWSIGIGSSVSGLPARSLGLGRTPASPGRPPRPRCLRVVDRADRAVAGLVRVRDPVGDRAVLERALVDRCRSPTSSSCGSVGKSSCQMKTATLIAISATVTTGNREVGMLSLSGITGAAKPSRVTRAPRRQRTIATWVHDHGGPTNADADPWRDTDVIDERAPRFNQAMTGLVALARCAAFGWPLAWALMAAQLLLGLTLGRRFCLPARLLRDRAAPLRRGPPRGLPPAPPGRT